MKYVPKKRWPRSAAVFASAVNDYGDKNSVAEFMGTSPSFVDSILRGIKPVPPWHATSLAQATKVSFDDFLEAHLEDVENCYVKAVGDRP